MRVLITHPDINNQGGVSNFYKQLQNKFNIPVLHFMIGKRPGEKGSISRIIRMFQDYYKFLECLKKNKIDLVHINPSLDLKSIIRDGMFVLLAKLNRKKILAFFRGWNKSFEARIEHGFIWIFKFIFGKCDAFIVLADEFKKTLKKWGIAPPIYQGVTVIDEDKLEGFIIKNVIKKRKNAKKWNVLFLSRILKEKGIYEVIEAISLLKAKYPMIELIVAGEGEELENVRSLVNERDISNIQFVGYVKDEEKRRLFEFSHVFCYPTYYGEGLPNCVVEAIAYGLPVVTRSVGGLVDFFINEEHGFITDSLDPVIIANSIERLFLDKELYSKISAHNYQYGQSYFLASKTISKLENIYKELMKDHNYS